jgi:hypothetical protein
MSQQQRPFQLFAWQKDFAREYLANPRTKSVLVAPPGSGKTLTSLYIADKLRERDDIDATLIITPHAVLRDQWSASARAHGLSLGETLQTSSGIGDGAVVTTPSLMSVVHETLFSDAVPMRRWLLVVDEADMILEPVEAVVDRLLATSTESKAIFLARTPLFKGSFEAEYRFDTEFILRRSALHHPGTEERIALYAPTFSLIRDLERQRLNLESLSWREFERLIATLLERDGYRVELMRGTKDGGVDVVAEKDLGPAGLFKSVWQAKKNALSNKVGLAVIRELADTRQEWGASKAVIVTSSYLTKGALARVHRDKHLMAKVDRDDLDAWVARALADGKQL